MSQPTTFTLDVNEDNDDGTTAAVTYTFTRSNTFENRVEYIESQSSLSMRDKIGLYRTMQKQNGNFRGVARTAVKITKDYEVPGVDAETTIVSPGVIDIGFNFPVGLTAAQTLALRMRACAMIMEDTIMVPLTDQLIVH
jgi:hypothetical protein